MKQSLTTLGYEVSRYSGHSFRRGGASFALECGISSDFIQSQGDWKSDAYKLYIDPSIQYRQDIVKVFASVLKGKHSNPGMLSK